jgi:hypothetical protein
MISPSDSSVRPWRRCARSPAPRAQPPRRARGRSLRSRRRDSQAWDLRLNSRRRDLAAFQTSRKDDRRVSDVLSLRCQRCTRSRPPFAHLAISENSIANGRCVTRSPTCSTTGVVITSMLRVSFNCSQGVSIPTRVASRSLAGVTSFPNENRSIRPSMSHRPHGNRRHGYSSRAGPRRNRSACSRCRARTPVRASTRSVGVHEHEIATRLVSFHWLIEHYATSAAMRSSSNRRASSAGR